MLIILLTGLQAPPRQELCFIHLCMLRAKYGTCNIIDAQYVC